MTVSQMTLTSSEESRQQRLFWLAEQIMNWSGVPVVHVRPTVLLDNPLFTVLASRSVRERDVLALPFGTGRTSPIAAEDVARVVAALLLTPPKARQVYGLTGPQVLDIKGLAEQYSRALGRTIRAEDIPYDDWLRQYLRNSGQSDLVQQVAEHPGHLCGHRQCLIDGDQIEDQLGALSAGNVFDALDRFLAGEQPLVGAHLLGDLELSAEVSTATMVVAVHSARRTWIAIWPRPPVPMTTAVEPGPST
jgi:hypothetical protein